MPASTVWNRTPLLPNSFAPLPATAVRPMEGLLDAVAGESHETGEGAFLKACLMNDAAGLDAQRQAILRRMDDPAWLDNDGIRTLLAYHAVSADKAVPLRMLRHAQALRERLIAGDAMPAAWRADLGDQLHLLIWLYSLTGQRGLIELAKRLRDVAPDWAVTLHTFAQTRPVLDAPPADADAHWRVHGRTIAAAMKVPALQALFEGGPKNETAFDAGWRKLMRFHGAAHGLWNADPLLAGGNPGLTAAPEAVRELFHSLRTLLWAQGHATYGDLLESLYFGAMRFAGARQAANQPHAQGVPGHHGSAQYAASLWMAARSEGLAAMGYAPSEVRWRLQGQLVRIRMETRYPAEETVLLRMDLREPLRFPLWLRIPAWAEGACYRINDALPVALTPGGMALIDRTWQAGDEILLTLPMQVRTARWYHQSVSVARGPLTYVLDAQKEPLWNSALILQGPFEAGVDAGIPTVSVRMAAVPEWAMRAEMPAPPPIAPRVERAAVRRVTLWPYGTAEARMAQFPEGTLDAE